MRKLLACLFAIALITGCKTTPLSPEPHQTKYTFQCLIASIPDDVFQEIAVGNDDNTPILNFSELQIQAFIQHPKSTIIRLPIVYAKIGESVTNDQTKTIDMAVDADIVDGKVVYKKEPQHLGEKVSVTVIENEEGIIRYKVDLMSRKLVGYNDYETDGGLNVSMPFFEKRGVNTRISQAADSWVTLGGLINQDGDGPKIHTMILIKIISPTQKP